MKIIKSLAEIKAELPPERQMRIKERASELIAKEYVLKTSAILAYLQSLKP